MLRQRDSGRGDNYLENDRPSATARLRGSPHQKLAGSIGADPETVVGGVFSRGPNGEIFTNEFSGHYWQNWTPETRAQFVRFMQEMTGQPVSHVAGP